MSGAAKKWPDVLSAWTGENDLFDGFFVAQFKLIDWNPSVADCRTAGLFHIELMSRISTQPLGYSEGTEAGALLSVYNLFEIAREMAQAPDLDGTFENVVWYVLNRHVRPFTAKWHRKGTSGALQALDATDEFRGELFTVQERLIDLDAILVLMAGGNRVGAKRSSPPKHAHIKNEMNDHIPIWRPMGVRAARPGPISDVVHEDFEIMRDKEAGMVGERRDTYGIRHTYWSTGIALSGGGIRSATFAMGVLASLAKRNLLPQFDYLSTVSGGGYAGSFLTHLLGSEAPDPEYGLKRDQLPFRRDEGESPILQKVRNNASYLSGATLERIFLVIGQAQGVFVNVLLLAMVTALIALLDIGVGRLFGPMKISIALYSLAILTLVFVITAVLRGYYSGLTTVIGWLGLACLVPVAYIVLQSAHSIGGFEYIDWRDADLDLIGRALGYFISAAGTVSAIGVTFSRRAQMRPVLISILTVLLLFCFELAIYSLLLPITNQATWPSVLLVIGVFALSAIFLVTFNINSTSLNAYYRAKLSKAFLLASGGAPGDVKKLSEFNPARAMFPIINCALNIPGTSGPRFRGRRSDLFSFTPVSGGASVLEHRPMTDWEGANPQLDLSMTMALSGAAVSPQMGLNTTKYKSFWLTLFNLRLNAWLRQPGKDARLKHPTVIQLFQEATASGSEESAYVNVSDGGHIENLGVYELLRRRCRFIVAVDGEEDAGMTFHGLTNLQRLAYIDLGITIEIDLDDLRMGDKGLSRSHFRFCRVRYPDGASNTGSQIGYLIYLKLSLTGNEGEFIRRYKFDDPAFPHNSTANQFFTDVQFEAYRALGEHVGDKMFLRALTDFDDGDNLNIEDWFLGLGKNFLDPLPNPLINAVASPS